MNPALWLCRAARLRPAAPALLSGTQVKADYQAFARHAASIGAALRARHRIAPGDRVAIFMGNCTDYLEILFGVWFAGAIAVPINAKLHAREAAWIISDSGARIVFSDDAHAGELGPMLPDCVDAVIVAHSADHRSLLQSAPMATPMAMGATDIIWLFYTSGTTGRPKGVMIMARNAAAMALAYFADVDPVYQSDAALYAAPMSHGAGLYCLQHVIAGARHVVPESGGFDAAEIAELAPQVDNVSMFAAPTMVRRMLDHAGRSSWRGEGIRTIVYGGGPMYLADIIDGVEVMGPRFVQIYGQGESPMTITALSRTIIADRTHPRWRDRLASVGVAQSPVRVMVADDTGAELPPGEKGEILVAGDVVMAGYWQNPVATAKTIRDGWLWTGDIGEMDEDGFLTLKDRSKDVIISGGANIYPREVEEALLTHDAVHEVSVVGSAHPEWGEEVVAFVVALPGKAIDGAMLDAHCLKQIARFKRPKRYEFVEALPKNNYGKVLKTELREHLTRGRTI